MIIWDAYNSVEYVELAELVAMRNSARRFYEDNWIVLEDTDEYTAIQLYEFLKVSKYYDKLKHFILWRFQTHYQDFSVVLQATSQSCVR